MNINCINNKIATANGVLQPVILQSIKDIYLNGNHQMTARMVRNQCIIVDNNIQWNGKPAAICNAMRNAIECSGNIFGEDRDFLDFTIAFDGNATNLDITTSKKISPKKSNHNSYIDKEIDKKLELSEWEKLKNKKNPKLLIIGCCNIKSIQPNLLANGGIVNYNFGNAINISRVNRLNIYRGLNANNFENIARGGQTYFMQALNNRNRRNSLDVYGSNQSPFYNPAMKALYRNKIANNGLHLLIISGLYGVIRHDDYINDYHLEINNGINVWGNNISNAVSEYIQVNNIDNDAVYYSLSSNYLPFLDPSPQWNNLWINYGGRGWNQAKDLNDFLVNL